MDKVYIRIAVHFYQDMF